VNPKKHDSQIFIGTFSLGHENVELYAITNERGGYFYTRPDDKSPARIKVSISVNHWDHCVSILLHETFEMAMTRARVRYEQDGYVGDTASYLFSFDHSKFVQICEDVAQFATPALPALAKAWRKNRRK
jgi:hypothetical protein